MTDQIEMSADGAVLTVVFNRPAQRNAMTWAMYEGLVRACERADTDDAIRVMVLRGAGGKAFVAGTDIAQFADFTTGDDGVEYEHRVGAVLGRLQQVEVPTIAAIDGYCVGGGLGIAGSTDLRLATPGSVFGVPIARTLGNCLSAATLSLLVHHFGHARVNTLLLTAKMMPAEEAHALGFVAELSDDLDTLTSKTVDRILAQAPLSMWATKETLRRLRQAAPAVDDTDIVSRVYASQDFHNAVQAFTTKQRPTWTGH